MAIIELASPRIRKRPLREKPGLAAVQIRKREYLPVPRAPLTADLFVALELRRSRRRYKRLHAMQLSTFLWHCARTKGTWKDAKGRRCEWRPAPSAGACHPHDIFCVQRARGGWQASIYDASSHALDHLYCASAVLRKLVEDVNAALPVRGATILWLAGNPYRTERYYDDPESLLWRDAGVLTAVMALVAEGMGLSFCPVGLTGEPHVSQILGGRSGIRGFGGALLGGRSEGPTGGH